MSAMKRVRKFKYKSLNVTSQFENATTRMIPTK
jgi:hypothetical protein